MIKVIVVDDNRDAADTLVTLLQRWGYTTVAAYDGACALELADTFSPDVVLLDLRMPGLTGFEVARRLHSLHPRMRLVALTGYGTTQDKADAYRAGFDCYLLKPVDVDTLNAVLRRYALIKSGRRTGQMGPAPNADGQPLID